MNWNKLLSTKRQQPVNRAYDPGHAGIGSHTLDDFHDDYLAIISSLAFRRLQDKTQVFPLDKSDFVRTRLTHSMEVSAIASELAKKIWYELVHKHNNSPNPQFGYDFFRLEDVPMVAACAGLLHDTGNPPFGHYGEEVIRDWFRRKLADPTFSFRGRPVKELFDAVSPQLCADFENFEGNAQGLRILSKSGLRESSHDVNLTFAVMNTLIKYPNPSTDFDKSSPDVKRHKMGYYYAEREVMDKICTATGTKVKGQYVRHPLVYIMEAADDIAYATADLADAVKKGRITVRGFIKFYMDRADVIENEGPKEAGEKARRARRAIRSLIENIDAKAETPSSADKKESVFRGSLAHSDTPEIEFAIFENWLATMRLWMMHSAEESFIANYRAIMRGTFPGELCADNESSPAMKIMKDAMRTYVYDSHEIVMLELSAKRILESLLEDFVRAVMYADEPEEKTHMSTIDDRFVHMIPDNFKMDYLGAKEQVEKRVEREAAKLKARLAGGEIGPDDAEREREKLRAAADAEELYLRFLMVTDFISGMTDGFARNLYHITNGLE